MGSDALSVAFAQRDEMAMRHDVDRRRRIGAPPRLYAHSEREAFDTTHAEEQPQSVSARVAADAEVPPADEVKHFFEALSRLESTFTEEERQRLRVTVAATPLPPQPLTPWTMNNTTTLVTIGLIAALAYAYCAPCSQERYRYGRGSAPRSDLSSTSTLNMGRLLKPLNPLR